MVEGHPHTTKHNNILLQPQRSSQHQQVIVAFDRGHIGIVRKYTKHSQVYYLNNNNNNNHSKEHVYSAPSSTISGSTRHALYRNTHHSHSSKLVSSKAEQLRLVTPKVGLVFLISPPLHFLREQYRRDSFLDYVYMFYVCKMCVFCNVPKLCKIWLSEKP